MKKVIIVLSFCWALLLTGCSSITNPTEATTTTESTTTAEATTTTQSTDAASEDNGDIDPDFKAAMDSYESFIDEYVEFMNKYAASDGTDMELLTDYAGFMKRYAEFSEDFAKWENEDMNAKEIAYYLDVQTRVSKKLLEAAQ